jgi:hypothetical protein
VDYKIYEQKGTNKERSKGSKGENIYKDNNNNSILGLMQRIKI